MGDICVKVVKVGMMRSNSKSGVGYDCIGDNYNCVITCNTSESEMRAEWIIYVCER